MPPPNPMSARLKIQLKLSISRLRHVQQKEIAVAKQQRRDIAQLLESGKDDSARIRVENIIRMEISAELLEILELYCELLLARIGLMDQRRECDPGLEEAVKSIIYAAGRTEIKELHQVRDIMGLKFGREFYRDALENATGKVSPKVVKKLAVEPPPAELITLYLQEVARTYRVPWSGLPEKERRHLAGDDSDDEPAGGVAEPADAPVAVPPISVAPPGSTTENPAPSVKGPLAPAPLAKGLSELDELSKRFQALKR
ncbi:regulator of Vps4 activity in the MVB pathway-domain-containing protein [Dipodascopsis tothii]|uniref:regulator of Vps4 activity in the MVB pathway-domain-containing protein n=1 Tax=Dipodascopsis tothii TaxID=44089 RepID=UPI0034CF45DA